MALIVALIGGVVVSRNQPSGAFPTMPADQQAFWRWVSTINLGTNTALEGGLDLLVRQSHLRSLYLRLADVCVEEDAVETCRWRFHEVTPRDRTTEVYRDAAMARLAESRSMAEAVSLWKLVAGSPHLDPALARRIVDLGRQDSTNWFEDVESEWRRQFDADSRASGAAFGLGYAAVLRNEWDEGESLLQQVARLLPHDPEAYRELGRIYFTTGRSDEFESTLLRGIEAARRRHDVDVELILRGNLGLAYRDRGELERAEEVFLAALEQSRAINDEVTEGFNLYRLSGIKARQFRFHEALAFDEEAESIYERRIPYRLPEVMAQRANNLASLWRFSDAEKVLDATVARARQVQNVEAELEALGVLARLRYLMGRFQAAREAAALGIDLAIQHRLIDREIFMRLNYGLVDAGEGNFESARQQYSRALALAIQSKNWGRQREVYLRLGHLAIDMYDANAAEDYYQTVLRGSRELGSDEGSFLAYVGLAQTYDLFGNHREAQRYYELAGEYIDQARHPSFLAELKIAHASSLVAGGNPRRADSLLLEAEALTTSTPFADISILTTRADIALANRDYAMALGIFERVDNLRRFYDWRPHWSVRHGMAASRWRLGDRTQAELDFRLAIATIEETRDNLTTSDDRAVFVHDKAAVYQNFVVFLEQQGRFGEAFHFSERSRSRALVDLLFTSQRERGLEEGNSVDQLIEINRRIQALSYAENGASADGIGMDVHESRPIDNIRRERARLDSIAASLQLSPANRLYTFDPLDLETAQATLEEKEALLVFDLRPQWLDADSISASVAYVIKPHRVDVRPLDLSLDDLPEVVRFFRDFISASNTGPGKGWEPASRRLYRELIAPVEDLLVSDVDHLHIVPEGVLYYVPFAALLDAEDRFLVEKYSISVTPSASILRLTRERNRRQWETMILLADPDGRLPGTRNEVQQIASIAPDKRQVLAGPSATKANLRHSISSADIIHLATHGRFIRRAPWRSHLELHGEVLSVSDIGRLNLSRSYLVTLSACETAVSSGNIADVPNGDEWVGFNQAFLAAGAPTVMATLWPIDDNVSSTFMVSFYNNLGPKGKAHALAEVQRSFIRGGRNPHPFYWAAFAVIGDPL